MGGGGRGEISRLLRMFAFAIILHVSDIFGMGIKFFRWGKTSQREVKISQVGTSETVKCVGSNFCHLIIQYSRINKLETLLRVTLKR